MATAVVAVFAAATAPSGVARGLNGAGGALSSPVAPIAGFATG
jgi:hypothetical protein